MRACGVRPAGRQALVDFVELDEAVREGHDKRNRPTCGDPGRDVVGFSRMTAGAQGALRSDLIDPTMAWRGAEKLMVIRDERIFEARRPFRHAYFRQYRLPGRRPGLRARGDARRRDRRRRRKASGHHRNGRLVGRSGPSWPAGQWRRQGRSSEQRPRGPRRPTAAL